MDNVPEDIQNQQPFTEKFKTHHIPSNTLNLQEEYPNNQGLKMVDLRESYQGN